MKLVLITVLAAVAQLSAQSVTSEPFGFNKVTCLANSDTIVGVPLRKEGSQSSKLASAPLINGDAATLTLTATNLTPDALTKHYVKFNSGTKDGCFYDITGNTANTVTINLNGDNLTGATTGDAVVIAEYWTLDSLFPPALATTDPTTTGHAIVASTSRFASGRLTEVLLPDLVGVGTNIAPIQTFFIYNGAWRKQGQAITSDFGSSILYADTYFIVRHPAAVTSSTTFRCLGEVELGNISIPLSTNAAAYQDNFIALPRPVAVTLDSLALVPEAFVASTSRFASGRKDELLVFNNIVNAFNKAPDVTYYYFNGAWRKHGQDYTVDFGLDTIPAGVGFLIRKAPNASTIFWKNPPNYSNVP